MRALTPAEWQQLDDAQGRSDRYAFLAGEVVGGSDGVFRAQNDKMPVIHYN